MVPRLGLGGLYHDGSDGTVGRWDMGGMGAEMKRELSRFICWWGFLFLLLAKYIHRQAASEKLKEMMDSLEDMD